MHDTIAASSLIADLLAIGQNPRSREDPLSEAERSQKKVCCPSLHASVDRISFSIDRTVMCACDTWCRSCYLEIETHVVMSPDMRCLTLAALQVVSDFSGDDALRQPRYVLSRCACL